MTRIVAGTAGGRRLQVPTGTATRPTSERVREALFAALAARGRLTGARVLDLYCGSGALGLEAASRGAAAVVLVDSGRAAVAAARANAAALRLPGVSVVQAPVARFLGREPAPHDLALLDPPYPLAEPELGTVLGRLAQGWLAQDATVVVERSTRSPEPDWPAGWSVRAGRRYGETTVWTVDC